MKGNVRKSYSFFLFRLLGRHTAWVKSRYTSILHRIEGRKYKGCGANVLWLRFFVLTLQLVRNNLLGKEMMRMIPFVSLRMNTIERVFGGYDARLLVIV